MFGYEHAGPGRICEAPTSQQSFQTIIPNLLADVINHRPILSKKDFSLTGHPLKAAPS